MSTIGRQFRTVSQYDQPNLFRLALTYELPVKSKGSSYSRRLANAALGGWSASSIVTDHLIQRQPPSCDLPAELAERQPTEAEEYRGEVVSYYPSTLPRASPDALYRALAQVAMKNSLRAGVAELARLVAWQQPREAEWYIQLGDAWIASGEPIKAVAAMNGQSG